MAVVRARSSPPYALIVFVFLWVVSTGIAVWLGVTNGDLQKKYADSEKKLSRVMQAGDTDGTVVAKWLVGKTNQSAVSVANKYITDLAKVIDPTADKTPEEVIAEGVKSMGSSKGLVAAVSELNGQLQQQQQQVTSLQAQKKSLEDQATQASQTQQQSMAAAQQSITKLQGELSKSTTEVAQERSDRESLLQKAEAKLTQVKDAAEADRREKVIHIEDLQHQLADKDSVIRDFKEKLAAMRPATTRLARVEPAGFVVRAQGVEECYIGLGRADRVMPGLTFAVYDPRLGVRIQGDTDVTKADAEAGNKAGIEVIEVGEHESLCRVTFLKKGQHIEQGDLVSNLAYQNEKNKKFHFVVFGEFDLDGDGIATASERDRLVRMITSAGGVVDDELSPQTDFLVLGGRPAAPTGKVVAGAEQPGGIADERIRVQKQYDDMAVEAKRSSVPILNGNRFLAMMGYYNTTIVR